MPDKWVWLGTGNTATSGTNAGWNDGTNWLLNGAANTAATTLPATGDFVSFESSTANISVGPNSTQATNRLATLSFMQSWTGIVPLTGMSIGADVVTVGQHYGQGSPAGSPRIYLTLTNTATNSATDILVYNTASSPQDTNKEPLRLVINNAASTLRVNRGIVGVGTDYSGQTSTLNSVDLDYAGSGNGQVQIGSGVTLTSYRQRGGACTGVVQTSVQTAEADSGTLTIVGSGNVTTLISGNGANVTYDADGTVSALAAYGEATIKRGTLSGATLYRGASLTADKAAVTLPTATSGTAALVLANCGLDDVTLDLGSNVAVRVN